MDSNTGDFNRSGFQTEAATKITAAVPVVDSWSWHSYLLAPHGAMRKMVEKVKVWKLMGRSLTSKAESAQAYGAKQIIHLWLLVTRQIHSHFQKSNYWSQIIVAGEGKHCNCAYVPYLFLSSAFTAEHNVIQYNIAFWTVWVSCPDCVPSAWVSGQHENESLDSASRNF